MKPVAKWLSAVVGDEGACVSEGGRSRGSSQVRGYETRG